MNVVRVGAVTIGQSPRDDVVRELSRRLGSEVELVQRGALDGISVDLIRANPPRSAETTLVSRLRDGNEVVVEKSFILPRLMQQIRFLEGEGVNVIILLCTHKFHEIDSGVALLRPADALERVVEGSKVSRLGVFTPAENQIGAQRVRWQGYASDAITVVAASPYLGGAGVEEAATRLRRSGVDIAVMDCIGYTETMRTRAQEILKVPVYSAVAALGDAIAEYLPTQQRLES